jgi:hypothetical protein
MLKDFRLNQIPLSDLLNLQKHLEFGQEHLRRLISQKGIEKLCSLDLLDTQVEKKLKTAPADITGTFTKFVNSALTAALGAWVVFNKISGTVLTSKFLFQGVLFCSLAIGAAIGIQNYRFTRKEIQKQLEKRKLQDIQLSILDFLNQHRLQEIKEKTGEINHLLQQLGIGYEMKWNSEETPPLSFYLRVFEEIEQAVQVRWQNQDPLIRRLFTDEWGVLQERVGQKLMDRSAPAKNIPPILIPLIETPLPQATQKKSWLQSNWRHILISGIPVLYGTFTSLFGASGDAKTIAKQVEWSEMYFFLIQPPMRTMGFLLAIAITSYLTFSFINKNRVKFRRDREIGKAAEQIIERQATLLERDDHILKLKEVLIAAQRICGIDKVLEKMSREKLLQQRR